MVSPLPTHLTPKMSQSWNPAKKRWNSVFASMGGHVSDCRDWISDSEVSITEDFVLILPKSYLHLPVFWVSQSRLGRSWGTGSFYLFKKIILFIYFWLCWVFGAPQAFCSCSEWEILSSCDAQASHCWGFSRCRAWALGCPDFSSCTTWTQKLQFLDSGAQAQ